MIFDNKYEGAEFVQVGFATDDIESFRKTHLENLQSTRDELSKYSEYFSGLARAGEKRPFDDTIEDDEISRNDELLKCLNRALENVKFYDDVIRDTKRFLVTQHKE